MTLATGLILVSLLTSLFWLLPIALLDRRYLHILQLEEYSSRRYLRWTRSPRADRARALRWPALALVVAAAAALLVRFNAVALILLLAWLIPAAWMAWALWPPPAKKPIVYTARIKRLICAVALVVLVVGGLAAGLAFAALRQSNSTAALVLAPVAAIAALLLLDSLLVVAANGIAQPVEAWLRRRYLNDAYKRIRRLKPKIIAITGSYGKTTTKELAAAILSTRFITSKTPESWNTLMGVTVRSASA